VIKIKETSAVIDNNKGVRCWQKEVSEIENIARVQKMLTR